MKKLIILGIVMMTGCASAVGWGKKYEVVHKTSKTITIKYDSILSDMKDFAPVADAHCKEYGKEAIPDNGRNDSQANSVYGGIQTVTFHCE